MKTDDSIIEKDIKQIIRLFYTSIVTYLLAAVVLVIMNDTKAASSPDLHTYLIILVPVLIVLSFFVRKYLCKKYKTNLPATLIERLATYKRAVFLSIAITEVPGVSALISLLLTANYYYLPMFGVSVLMFITFISSVATFQRDYNP